MTEDINTPQSERMLLSSHGEYLGSMQRVFGLAQKELRIFDLDLSRLQIDTPHSNDILRNFLLDGRENRLFIAVHGTDYIRSYCPRLLNLLRQFSDRLFIRQTQDDAARAQDCFVLADKLHSVRRPVQAQVRAVLKLHDEQEGLGLHQRFTEIWDSSIPAVSAATSGL